MYIMCTYENINIILIDQPSVRCIWHRYSIVSSLGPVGTPTAVIKYAILADIDDASESHGLVTVTNLECGG